MYPVAHLQPLCTFVGAALHKAGEHRGNEGLSSGVEKADYQKAQHEVHKGACHKDNYSLEGMLVCKGSGVVGLFILPCHGAVTPYGYAPEGILRLLPLLFEYGRTHADCKLVDPHAEGLCRGKMPELVNAYEYTEKQNCQNDIKCVHQV